MPAPIQPSLQPPYSGVNELLLRCPAAVFTTALLLRAGVPLGWYVLSRVGSQVGLPIWVNSGSAADWSAAIHSPCAPSRRPQAWAGGLRSFTRRRSRDPRRLPVPSCRARIRSGPPKLFAAFQPLNLTFVRVTGLRIRPAYPISHSSAAALQNGSLTNPDAEPRTW
jgi:hypothetical protein